jgi:hypothetical protein
MRGTLLWTFHFVFRTPAAEARALLPTTLEPVTVDGWAFYNIAVCEFEALRGASNPFRIGRKGHLVAYRLYARTPGNPAVGLFGLQTECDDSTTLEKTGSLAGTPTTLCSVEVYDDTHGTVQIESEDSPTPFKVVLDTRGKPVRKPESPFSSLSEGAALLRPPTVLLDAKGQRQEIGRSESRWDSRLVRVTQETWKFFDEKSVELEFCYDVGPLDYRWPEGFALAP